MGEFWRGVDGYEAEYEISTSGRVRSLKWGKSRILKNRATHSGYFSVNLRKDSISKDTKVHRLVAQAFLENLENKPTVNHKDGDKRNNHVDNLEWATYKENTQHALRTGLLHHEKTTGSLHGGAKLDEEKVLVIRWIRANYNFTLKQIGKMFGVSYVTIHSVVSRANWKHV